MQNDRQKRAKTNIIVSLVNQVVVMICGLITPRLMLIAYGSEAYGMTTSIAQFLGYITLLEGGIGGVARAALYKPLAKNNIEEISEVLNEIKRFFRIIAYIFCVYVLVLATTFKFISHTNLDMWTTFFLVLSISVSTFGQYFVGISYSILLQAAQKAYINNSISIGLALLNTSVIVLMINCGCDLIIVKLASSCVFLIRPFALWIYSMKHYRFVKNVKSNSNLLKQKWNGLGQHIAFFLHSHTDTVVLTIFSSLTSVAVYSVYNMIINNIKNFAMSFHSGMEAVFGDMLAKKEMTQLEKTFEKYEIVISIVAVILFSVTSVMIVPFVRLYTKGINDANYIMPAFAIVLILAAMLYCLRAPYHSIIVAAGHFKETQSAAYGETLINIGLSVVLVFKFDLIGVAVATVIATWYRFMYYVWYLSKNIICRSKVYFFYRCFTNLLVFSIAVVIGKLIIAFNDINNYFQWVIVAFEVTSMTLVIAIIINCINYPTFLEEIKNWIKCKFM